VTLHSLKPVLDGLEKPDTATISFYDTSCASGGSKPHLLIITMTVNAVSKTHMLSDSFRKSTQSPMINIDYPEQSHVQDAQEGRWRLPYVTP